MKLVECVPNFSEGKNLDIINAISESIKNVNGVKLLDVDPGAATNRTVFTFVGTPDAVVDAAYEAIATGSKLIDMTKHKGEHARMGACDVCPFIPISNITYEECIELAKKLGKRVGDELNIPIYLYEKAASKKERENLAYVREGEYEGLENKLKKEEHKPDFGKAVFNSKSGATAIGVREFLIAYNINLNTSSKKRAHDIALNIREKGKFKRDKNNKFVKDKNGKKVRQPGLFKHVKAVGWFIDEYKQAQISINLTNYHISPPHLVLEEVRKQAYEKGIIVTGSEIVGLIPKEAMLMAAEYYLEKQGGPVGIPEKDRIRCAVQAMGLNDVSEFNINKKIIEYCLNKNEKLISMPVKNFVEELSSDSKAPGGGSVAALCLSLGASLATMVSNLTYSKKGFEKHQEKIDKISIAAHKLKYTALSAIDADTDAFMEIMNASKIKAKTDDEKIKKAKLIEMATVKATNIPLSVLKESLCVLELLEEMIDISNPSAISDIGVGALCVKTAAISAYFNVIINLPGIKDKTIHKNIKTMANNLKNKVTPIADNIEKRILELLS